MKRIYLLPLLFLLFLSACSKDKEVEPDLAANIEGNYQATRISTNSQSVTLPQQGITVGVKLTRTEKDKANFQITINLGGTISQEDGEVLLTKSGNRTLMKVETNNFGYVEEKNMFLDFISEDGSRVQLDANRL